MLLDPSVGFPAPAQTRFARHPARYPGIEPAILSVWKGGEELYRTGRGGAHLDVPVFQKDGFFRQLEIGFQQSGIIFTYINLQHRFLTSVLIPE